MRFNFQSAMEKPACIFTNSTCSSCKGCSDRAGTGCYLIFKISSNFFKVTLPFFPNNYSHLLYCKYYYYYLLSQLKKEALSAKEKAKQYRARSENSFDHIYNLEIGTYCVHTIAPKKFIIIYVMFRKTQS